MRLSRTLPDRVSPDAYFRNYQHPIDVCAIGKDRVEASHYVENLVGGARFETIDAPETIRARSYLIAAFSIAYRRIRGV
jgi:hypothetical protein